MAGTVLDREQLQRSMQSGALATFSPGFSEDVCNFAADSNFAYIPAASTMSELMAIYNLGFRLAKVFPIKVLGGLPLLKAWHAPLPDMNFCPTGGLRQDDIKDYLEFAPVTAVGGGWLVTAEDLDNSAWSEITRKASLASALL